MEPISLSFYQHLNLIIFALSIALLVKQKKFKMLVFSKLLKYTREKISTTQFILDCIVWINQKNFFKMKKFFLI
jgi:hypothetical protein